MGHFTLTVLCSVKIMYLMNQYIITDILCLQSQNFSESNAHAQFGNFDKIEMVR